MGIRKATISLVYVPGRGVTVTLKGQVKGTIGGADFASALFAIWLGPDPADDDLKDALLGKQVRARYQTPVGTDSHR